MRSSRNVFNQSVFLDLEDAVLTSLLKTYPQNVCFVSPDIRKRWIFLSQNQIPSKSFRAHLEFKFVKIAGKKFAISLILSSLMSKKDKDNFSVKKTSRWSSGHAKCRSNKTTGNFLLRSRKGFVKKPKRTWKVLFFQKKIFPGTNWMQFWLPLRNFTERRKSFCSRSDYEAFFWDKNVKISPGQLKRIFATPLKVFVRFCSNF